MAARSPVRYLAPIALVVTFLAVIVVLASFDGGDSDPGERTRPATVERKVPARRTYVVREGDTLVAIADRFGLTQERLLALNPDLDAQALQPGRRLKLRP